MKERKKERMEGKERKKEKNYGTTNELNVKRGMKEVKKE